MKAKNWLIGWGIMVVSALFFMGFWVYRVDPYFHYHAPDTGKYFYVLDNQRSQNDGICRHFDYDAMVTGTSMTENFKTSEAEDVFGGHFIKVTYSGASYKEINDNMRTAFSAKPGITTVIRCLDMLRFLDTSDLMRSDLGEFPDYLYDDILMNDVKYLLNRDVIFGRVYKMTQDAKQEGFKPGITSFDDYSRWQPRFVFGINTVCPDGIAVSAPAEQPHLTEEDREVIRENIELNVTGLADEHPDVDFYYFYSPYSIVMWNKWSNSGELNKICEAEDYITELILEHENIHLFSFNNRTDIITDLNHYKDEYHYGEWVNSLMLKWMHDGTYQLTKDNYQERLEEEHRFYKEYNYASIGRQEDYEADYYAAALLNKELTGAEPINVLYADGSDVDKENEDVMGVKLTVDLDQGYNYLCFNGKKIRGSGSPAICVYDENGNKIEIPYAKPSVPDEKEHMYVADLSKLSGKVTITLSGGEMNGAESVETKYAFSNVYIY